MDRINNNPYRILGVFSNATLKEITANKTKLARYASVGKSVSFDADMNGLLPPVDRSEASVEKAYADLSLAQDKLKHALFWFVKDSDIDEVAFQLLSEGKIREAKLTWETAKIVNFSSVQNRVVCNLIEENLETALVMAEFLYESFTFSDTFIDKVNPNSTMKMSGKELLHLFIDTLGEEVGMTKLFGLELLQKETKHYIKDRIVDPLVNCISDEVEKAKNIDHQDATKRRLAGEALVTKTKRPLEELRQVLGVADTQYGVLVDKLGLEILQCGIDYFNHTEDADAAYKAMELQQAAQAIVVGDAAKQRCNENIEILKKNIANMAPREVLVEDKAINALLEEALEMPDEISFSIDLLNKAKPYLQSIKSKLGAKDDYYLKMSTAVVSVALNKVIQVVNDAQNEKKRLYEASGNTTVDYILDSMEEAGLNDYYYHNGRRYTSPDAIKRTIDALKEAWPAILLMDSFDIDSEFKEHYDKNRRALQSLCVSLGVESTITESNKIRRITRKLFIRKKEKSFEDYTDEDWKKWKEEQDEDYKKRREKEDEDFRKFREKLEKDLKKNGGKFVIGKDENEDLKGMLGCSAGLAVVIIVVGLIWNKTLSGYLLGFAAWILLQMALFVREFKTKERLFFAALAVISGIITYFLLK